MFSHLLAALCCQSLSKVLGYARRAINRNWLFGQISDQPRREQERVTVDEPAAGYQAPCGATTPHRSHGEGGETCDGRPLIMKPTGPAEPPLTHPGAVTNSRSYASPPRIEQAAARMPAWPATAEIVRPVLRVEMLKHSGSACHPVEFVSDVTRHGGRASNIPVVPVTMMRDESQLFAVQVSGTKTLRVRSNHHEAQPRFQRTGHRRPEGAFPSFAGRAASPRAPGRRWPGQRLPGG